MEQGGHPVAGANAQCHRSPSIGVSSVVSVWARSIFSSSCVDVRAWCLVSAALLPAAAQGGRARCVRCAVRCVCARAEVLWLRLMQRRRMRSDSRGAWHAGPVRCERGGCVRACWTQRWVFLFSCKQGAAPAQAACVCPPCSCARDAVDVVAVLHAKSRGLQCCSGRLSNAPSTRAGVSCLGVDGLPSYAPVGQ